MSFILEALKRVEREREAAGQPRLGAVQRLPTPRRFVWPWVFCIALAVNAGVVWTLWQPVPPTAEGVGPPITPPAPAAVAGGKAGRKPRRPATGPRNRNLQINLLAINLMAAASRNP